MKIGAEKSNARGLAALREFVRKPPKEEHCDLCSLTLADQHQHLVDSGTRRLLCVCDPCAILFSASGATRYRRVPRDSRHLSNFRLSEQAWSSLAIPIGLVFIYSSSATGQVLAVYPSPAGPTETVLDQESWEEIVAENPVLAKLTPDVEALLINRMNGAREYFLTPIDECYKLTGLVRTHWRGFSGGEEGWEQIRHFFDRLQDRSSTSAAGAHARSIV